MAGLWRSTTTSRDNLREHANVARQGASCLFIIDHDKGGFEPQDSGDTRWEPWIFCAYKRWMRPYSYHPNSCAFAVAFALSIRSVVCIRYLLCTIYSHSVFTAWHSPWAFAHICLPGLKWVKVSILFHIHSHGWHYYGDLGWSSSEAAPSSVVGLTYRSLCNLCGYAVLEQGTLQRAAVRLLPQEPANQIFHYSILRGCLSFYIVNNRQQRAGAQERVCCLVESWRLNVFARFGKTVTVAFVSCAAGGRRIKDVGKSQSFLLFTVHHLIMWLMSPQS